MRTDTLPKSPSPNVLITTIALFAGGPLTDILTFSGDQQQTDGAAQGARPRMQARLHKRKAYRGLKRRYDFSTEVHILGFVKDARPCMQALTHARKAYGGLE